MQRHTLDDRSRRLREGEAFVERIGRYRGAVDRERVRDLARLVLRLGFADVEPEHLPPGTCMLPRELVLWSGPWSRRVVVIDHDHRLLNPVAAMWRHTW